MEKSVLINNVAENFTIFYTTVASKLADKLLRSY